MALTHVLHDRTLKSAASLCPIYLLSDSLWSINVLKKGFSSDKQLNRLVVAILELTTAIATIRPPRRYWIPGHVELRGNVFADALALLGSGLSKEQRSPDMSLAETNCISTFNNNFHYSVQRHGRLFPY